MSKRPEDRTEVPRLWPFLLLCAAVAVWIDLGRIQRHHYGESLVPILVSLYHWSPFFWDSDHVGMLVPLIASPIKDPLVNLLFQTGINIFCGLSVFFLLARYALRDRSYPVVGALGASAFVALTPEGYSFDFLVTTLHSVALALGLGGLNLLVPRPGGGVAPRRAAAALGLFVLAHWVFAATALVLAPLVLFRALSAAATSGGGGAKGFGGRWRAASTSEPGVALVLLGLALAAGLGMMYLAPRQHIIQTTALPFSEWVPSLTQFLGKTLLNLGPNWWLWGLAFSALAGLFLLNVPAVSRRASALRPAGPLVLAGAVHAVYMGSRAYIKSPGIYMPRYLMADMLMLQAALLVVAVSPLCHALGRRALGVAYGLTAPLLLLSATWGFGAPSLAVVRAELQRSNGGSTAAVIDTGCTHVAGDYYQVWSAVFHANLTLHERGERRIVWGITYNSESTSYLWKRVPPERMRVAIHVADAPVAWGQLARFGFPHFTVIAMCPGMAVVRPSTTVPRQGDPPRVAAGRAGAVAR